MKIPLYWARSDVEFFNADGKKCWLDCWGWSDVSQEDAARHAHERAEKAIAHNLKRAVPYEYLAYSDLPLREELVQEFHDVQGKRHAAITRNAIGCWVLNTTSQPFIDVDGPIPEQEGFFSMLIRVLRGQERERDPWYQREPQHATQLVDFVARHNIGARFYRTKAGERYLLTGIPLDPTSEQTAEFMTELEADPLYTKLCRVQECFRARLTPKPYRCKVSQCLERDPWRDRYDEQAFLRWQKVYQRQAKDYATCHFVEHLGNPDMTDKEQAMVELHDELTRATSDLPLA